MDRRTILKYTAYATGFAIAAPLTSALFSGCKAEPAAPDYKPVFLDADTYKSVAAMAEAMLPATKTPGAAEVGVPAFIDRVLAGYTEPEHQTRIQTGMAAWLQSVATANGGKAYHALEPTQQLSLLNTLDTESKAAAEALPTSGLSPEEREMRYPWWLSVKELAIGGYFSSEKIGTEVLAYDPIPGVYQGCIPLSDVGATWSLP